ncbi:hypothetical protein GKZ68_03140 [Hymenobacter sp. BRD128]|uniref:hypothetical protein n=1 Tax=Hymenobacter sp. BRD128 TaxID=2675878 RepID=UPI00156503BE|nr:hypothetical protein [Hymenobacter sp. BRD128]QKG55724.1 hypothetical protein GKZ68_03140 [Hymenobacter sp. BRD128]
MLLSDFWAQQQFSYLVTYSFQRGPKLIALKKQLQQELVTARYMRRAAIQRQIDELKRPSLTLTKGLGPVHSTATAVARLAAGSVEAQQLSYELQISTKQEWYAMCTPIYRDALAFYNEANELISILNIYFHCCFMCTDQLEAVEADMATYDILRAFLIRLGCTDNYLCVREQSG